MQVGDLVARKHSPRKILGLIMHLFEICNRRMHRGPLPMVEIMTKDGPRIWKRRKIKVFNESR